MSRIDELVERLCPDGVEYKPLGEVGSFVRGSGLQKKDLANSGFPAIHYGQIHTHYGVWTDEAISFVDPAFARKLRKAEPGDLLIATTSEDDQAVAKSVAWLGSTEVAISGDSFAYHHTLDPKFVSYYFQSAEFQDQKKLRITGTKVRRISASALSMIRVPVPPLEIQTEIVRVLDRLTSLERELETELEAELEARGRQFSYFRRELLTFGGDVKSVPLGDIATIGTGSRDTRDAVVAGEFVFYARGRQPLRLNEFDFDEVSIVTAGDGVGVGEVFHFAEGKYALHQRAYRIVPSVHVDPRFLYHYLITDFSRYLRKVSFHASVTSLRRPMLTNYPIALPSLAQQRSISRILDGFDSLTNGMTVGLPAEISARRQQYEYYRDRLLTFKEKAS